MKRLILPIIAIAMSLSGCVGSETGDSTLGLLPASLEGRTDLVLDESVARHPLLRSDSRLSDQAIDIQIEIADGIVMAWSGPERSRDTLAALWTIEPIAAVDATEDPEPQPSVPESEGSDLLLEIPGLEQDLEAGPELQTELLLLDLENLVYLPEQLDPAAWELLRTMHPTCE